jgi:lysylphosphatidylglycerol synthetase-like protein (DUF2156 family)
MELVNNQREKSVWVRLPALSLAAGLLFSLISITLMESFLALAFLFWLVALFRREQRLRIPGFGWPLLAYAGLSIIVCFFSVNPAASFKDARSSFSFSSSPSP